MIPLYQHPYAPFLSRVSKPTRYTGSEHGVRRKAWDAVEARVCLAFPDLYDVGMSHLGYRILYRILNDDERTLAERCYTPWVDLLAELRAHDVPLVSLESARPLADFDVVGFSLQFELTFTNVLLMLDLGRIPLRAAARDERAPLVIAGGPVAAHPEPLAPFVDAFLIGDGEEATTELALTWTRARRDGLPRAERLAALSQIEGVYVPSRYEVAPDAASGRVVVQAPGSGAAPFPVRRRVLPTLDRFPFPTGGPVGGPEAVFDRTSIEVARGCTEGCRFCQAGMIYRPVRERDPAGVVATVLAAIDETGQDEVSLTALSTADVSAIAPLIKTLARITAPRRVSLGVASLRAYGLPEDVLDAMSQVRASGLTLAPEAGTQRLRDVINKNVTEPQLIETAERVAARGHDRLKLYFIVGLPTETDEDVLAIAALGRAVLAAGRRRNRRATVTVSVSNHVPKPHTPFQWCAMDARPELERKQRALREAVRGVRGLTLKTHDAATSVLEGILARGDRRLADVVERAYRGGACFDAWEDQLRLDVWQAAFESCGVDPESYLHALPVGARLPWDHVDVGLSPGFLARELRRALQARTTPPCGKAAGQPVHPTNVAAAEAETRHLPCHDCGVGCDLRAMRSARLDSLRRLEALAPAGQEGSGPSGSAPTAPALQTGGAVVSEDLAPVAPAASAGGSERHRDPERRRPPQAGGPTPRWRVRYSKLGAMALLGHLDLIRELGRVFRRARVTVAYTTGFHPKPAMSFSPALPLGMPSLGEYLDVKLLDAPAAGELVAALGRVACDGLEFTAAAALGPEDPGLAAVVDGAAYLIALPHSAVLALDGEAGLAARLAELQNDAPRAGERTRRGRSRRFDLGSELRYIAPASAADHAALAAAGEAPADMVLRVELALGPGGGVRPSEVVSALAGGQALDHRVLRLGLRAGAGDPLDLARLRRETRARAGARAPDPTAPAPPLSR